MNAVYAYEAYYGIVVKAERHDICLCNYNRIKALAKAFDATITREYKSARKGDVLSREIHINFKAYAHDTILFRDALDAIIRSINIYTPVVEACYSSSTVERIDARFGLPK